MYKSAEDIFEFVELSKQTDEPYILKISAYMIYLETVVDLLSPRKMGVKMDHFLSASREEVISKITNLKEKITPTMNDLKDTILEVNRSKKLHTAFYKGEANLDRKCHIVISLKLDRKVGGVYKKFSQLNFCELCGSEQAVAQVEESYNESTDDPNLSIRDFATHSFNSLSANLLIIALRGKVKTDSSKNESMIVKCLNETMTYKSKILLICTVSPISEFFDHSLPALKFCAKIRHCIHKNLIKLKYKSKRKSLSKHLSITGQNEVSESEL